MDEHLNDSGELSGDEFSGEEGSDDEGSDDEFTNFGGADIPPPIKPGICYANRKEAVRAVHRLAMDQNRAVKQNSSNKGGKTLSLRCVGYSTTQCPVEYRFNQLQSKEWRTTFINQNHGECLATGGFDVSRAVADPRIANAIIVAYAKGSKISTKDFNNLYGCTARPYQKTRLVERIIQGVKAQSDSKYQLIVGYVKNMVKANEGLVIALRFIKPDGAALDVEFEGDEETTPEWDGARFSSMIVLSEIGRRLLDVVDVIAMDGCSVKTGDGIFLTVDTSIANKNIPIAYGWMESEDSACWGRVVDFVKKHSSFGRKRHLVISDLDKGLANALQRVQFDPATGQGVHAAHCTHHLGEIVLKSMGTRKGSDGAPIPVRIYHQSPKLTNPSAYCSSPWSKLLRLSNETTCCRV